MSNRFVRAMLLVSCISQAAHAGLQVPPVTGLPPAPTAPKLWFDGSDAAVIAALQARIANARTSPSFNAFKSFVDARLATLATADDDTRSKIVKAAGLLHVLGLSPPATQAAYPSYRAVAVAAFIGVGTREAIDTLGEFLLPPANAINILQDASRLQSLAEGFDFLRGAAGTSDEEHKKMAAILANWAEALRTDWNLAGAAGIPGHRDNWGIKGGSALVTVALAAPELAQAAGWLTTGMLYLNGSLDVVASPTGWFGESVWYLNYSLANLLPAAWHAKNAAAKDWFPALEPLVLASLAWRQPDGTAPPFEEGIANTFPWNALASAYPELAPQMLWAWDNSPKTVENFDNQQIHDVTRFLLIDLTSVAAAPTTPVTRFLPNDAHLVALRSSWGKDALQVTSLTARDYSTSELNTSRHNMRNPLDLVLHGAGFLALPTASGGPQVTSSANRATYLSVLAKNIPLVNGQAPFVVAASNVTLSERVDSEDEGTHPNHYVDMARTTLGQVYAETREVSRVVAMIDRSYVVVLDRFNAQSSRNYQLSWRGRGARTTRSNTNALQAFSWAGTSAQSPRLDLDVVASGNLALTANESLYAPAWNVEEAIDGVLVGTNANNAAFISVLQVGGNAARVVAPIALTGTPGAAGANIVSGTLKDTVIFNALSGEISADGVLSNGVATMVRRDAGVVSAFAVSSGSKLEIGNVKLAASAPLTLALTASGDSLAFELSADLAGSVDLALEALPGIDPNTRYRGYKDGVLLGAGFRQDGGRLDFLAIGAGTFVVEPVPCTAGSGPDPDGDLFCGDADNCPSTANADQTDSDGDGVGDACECLDQASRCDDANVCTSDACMSATGACTHSAVPANPACDDGNACTVADACNAGACGGTTRSCDDGNDCTSDTCAPATGCLNSARNGQGCDDGDLCSSGDRCVGTACSGAAIVCDDGNPCTADACRSDIGCLIGAVLNGAPCDDGDICTDDDSCVGANCTGAAIICDDGNGCTADACDSNRGCVASPLAGACDDQDRCTRDDVCAGAPVDCGGTPVDCDDGNPCTTDVCDASLGCQHAAGRDGEACDDGNACTTGDLCGAGRCMGAGLQCDDGNPCTVDSCALGSGCVSVPADFGAPCDDGDPCRDEDRCDAGVCIGTAVQCDDADPCTNDRCDPELGACVAQAIACDEGSFCEDGECHLIDTEPEADDGPEAVEVAPEAIETAPELSDDGAGELTPERDPEADADADDDTSAQAEAGDDTNAQTDADANDDTSAQAEAGDDTSGQAEAGDDTTADATTDPEGLDFSASESQVIGKGSDDGCGAAGSGPGLGALLALWLLGLRALAPGHGNRLRTRS